MAFVTRLIAVSGASPGIGKTTLTRRLATEADLIGHVDRFNEEEILSRREFENVAAQFQSIGTVDLDVLLIASERFVASALAYDVVVTDSLFPFVASLVAWGHDEETIQAFLVQLRAILDQLDPVVLYLDGDPTEALQRAADRSGKAWLDNFLVKTATYKVTPPIRDLETTIAHLRRERDISVRCMIAAGYDIVTIYDAHSRTTDDVASEALSRVGLID
jgi:thymidylate kinase